MASGFHEDDLPGGTLPLPVLKDDHVLIGRGGVTYRVDKRIVSNPAPILAIQRPQLADFATWVNQSVASAADHDYGFSIYSPARGNTDSLNMRSRALPAGDRWLVGMGIHFYAPFKGNLAAGIAIRETATTKLELLGIGRPNNSGSANEKWSTPTGGRSTRQGTGDNTHSAFLRFIRGGNHYQPFISMDGVHFSAFDDPILMLDFFTVEPNHWGLWVNTNNVGTPNLDGHVFAYHYEETTGTPPDNIFDLGASYLNKNGSGNRSALITVTTDATLTGSISELVDGDYLTNTSKPFFTADATGNRQITFQFGAAKLLTEAKFYMNSPSSQGTWKWRNSPDGVTYTDRGVGTFTLTGSSAGTVLGDLSTNTSAQPYWRMQQTAGALTNTPFLRQIDFKIQN